MNSMKTKTFWLCIISGVIIRFLLMSLGHNFDFESWCIVGELVSAGKNVYANTTRYNYGPVWFVLLGLFWKASSYFANSIVVFRVLIVSTLTLADFLIARLVSRKAGNFWGAVFFLNPLSILTAGYLNQFDGLAVAFAAYGISYLEDSAETERFTINDAAGITLLSMSFISKHIMWAFPLWLLFSSRINTRKKVLYAFVPVLLFLMSFAPYWSTGQQGIISNVFLYRSRNNFPLFGLDILHRIMNHLPVFSRNVTDPYGMALLPFHKYLFPVYGLFMLAGAYIFRHEDINNNFLLYTISVVCFASAISTQYLSIPCMALIILCRKKSLLYFPFIGMIIFGKHIVKITMVWALLLYLVDYYRHNMSR